MSKEVTQSKDEKLPDPENVLKEVKDQGVLLRMANEYLCEPPLMKKMGLQLEEKTAILKDHLGVLRANFIGKPAEEIDFKRYFTELGDIANELKDPSTRTGNRCKQGEIGRQIEEKTAEFAIALAALRDKIEGGPSSLGGKIYFFGLRSRAAAVLHRLSATYPLISKAAVLVFLTLLGTLAYLYISMENNQKALAEKIREFRASIHAKQQALNRVEEEISSINRQIRVVEAAEEMSRQQRINFLDLNLEAHKLTDKRDKYQFEIEIQQKALAENLETMEEMEKKSFFKRLLRR